MPLLAQVAISGATPTYDKLYTYSVPTAMQGHIFVGSMVLVPFGRGSTRPRTGVVLELAETAETPPRTKLLSAVAPEDARLTSELLATVRYLKEATMCTWYEAVRAVIPFGAQFKAVQLDGGWVLQKQLRRHTETLYTATGAEGAKMPALKQQSVLDALQSGPLPRAQLLERCGIGRGVLDTMVKNGLLEANEHDMRVEVAATLPGQEAGAAREVLPELSAAQREVADGLLAMMAAESRKPALLYGVTGSGKTSLFYTLIQKALDGGRTALVLVPEIGLTPQMIAGLRAVFGSKVAVQHSGLSNTERLLQWRGVQRGEAQVVVGTRSAVFAPLENLGVIIVDEEQERSYQSESAPRYDAIEVAKRRAVYHGALLLLASATPSIASYHAAQQGRYELFCLTERYGHLPLPSVEMVDMREDALLGGSGAVSGRLAAAIRENLEKGSQTILLLNRRGYNRVAVCRDCGEPLKCAAGCSVPLVYHKAEGRMLCHYCGYQIQPPPTECPECGGELRYTGVGTQRLEDELAEKFPTARILRMDTDSTSRKNAHAEMLAAFARSEYDILLGTQMVAKGLDFERVSLVGVIGIDSLLFSQGYRAFENVFSLVTQVVGRSGRAGAPGRAMIQTADPENPVLTLAARQDYDAFYRQEIAFRKLALYPPYCTICVVGFVGENEAETLRAARRFGVIMAGLATQNKAIPLRILGPAPMHVAQIAGSYRYRLTLKCRNDAAFRALAMQALAAYNKEGLARKVSLWLDFHSDAGT